MTFTTTMSSLLNDPTVILALVTTVACLVVGGLVSRSGRKVKKKNKTTKATQQNAKAGKQQPASAAAGKAASEKNINTAKTVQSTAPSSPSSSQSSTTTSALNENSNPVDVWAERRQRGIMPASMDRKGGAKTDKPFGSSYYYAHNNPNTTGGYKDGLRMEDYAMNGPRLLSKGGKRVTDDEAATASAATTTTTTTTTPTSTTTQEAVAEAESATKSESINETAPKKKRVLPITQYLWDDEGGKTATIIIEKLPGGLRSTDAPLAWSTAPVQNIQATLFGGDQGLHVEVETTLDWDYVLQVDRLFASVTAVQAIVKPNRLRVKLTKKSTSIIMSSYDKWPHPHKKKV